ncbi:transmembrane protein 179B [Varanus komodoensis]|uniref:Transmembrane protein 179B n=1 Tax=Varanus komodoensis TaxID=61221 RepID=A0A8D2KTD5_VARKO|nr:transmembrane protein 179B [Varanus komodoensis]
MARLSAFQLAGLGLSAAAFLCGIICASALTVTQGEFGSQCILYGSVRYNGTLSLSRVSHSSLCYFVSATSVLASILSFAVLFQGIYHGCFGDGQSEHTWFKGSVAIAAAVLFFLLVSGCILRVGMDTLCAAIVQSSAAASCQEAQRRPWVHPYRAEKFYDNLYTAEAAAWVNFFFWCLMVVLLVLERFIKSSSQPLRSSSARTDEAAPIIGGGPRGP